MQPVGFDMTSFLTWFIDIIIQIFTYVYSTLDSITFMGISLLQYLITLLILYPILTLLFTLVNNEASYSKAEMNREVSKARWKALKDKEVRQKRG